VKLSILYLARVSKSRYKVDEMSVQEVVFILNAEKVLYLLLTGHGYVIKQIFYNYIYIHTHTKVTRKHKWYSDRLQAGLPGVGVEIFESHPAWP
jgi:hypothetical protein